MNNNNNNKIIVGDRNRTERTGFTLNWGTIEEVKEFVDLVSTITIDGSLSNEIKK